MNAESENASIKKRSPVSVPLLLVVGALAIGAYFAGPWVMAQIMYRTNTMGSLSGMGEEDDGGVVIDPVQGALGGAGGGAGNGGRGGGAAWDPVAFFAERDADGNGKLEGDEISERMRERLAEIDTDADGAVSQEELQAGMQAGRGGRDRSDNRPSSGGDAASEPEAGETESNSQTNSAPSVLPSDLPNANPDTTTEAGDSN